MFFNKYYCVNILCHNNNIIHRSLVTPGYFRFPFMKKNDLQLGDIWTDPSFRGQGIASCSTSQVINHFCEKGFKFWYVVDEKNVPSIRLAEKLGFTLYGKGVRKSILGMRAIGQYIILNKFSSN
ncbi:MAG: N-acetyltransferase [Candidatus Electrothrix sp. AR3]|nr:N-acetyltransferase [Candidatus Electrothrix sp. AR3]